MTCPSCGDEMVPPWHPRDKRFKFLCLGCGHYEPVADTPEIVAEKAKKARAVMGKALRIFGGKK